MFRLMSAIQHFLLFKRGILHSNHQNESEGFSRKTNEFSRKLETIFVLNKNWMNLMSLEEVFNESKEKPNQQTKSWKKD